MNFKVLTSSGDEIDQLEDKLNQLILRPELSGFKLAACFPTSDFESIFLVFQK